MLFAIVAFEACDALLLSLWLTDGVREYVGPECFLDKLVSLWFRFPASALLSVVPVLVFGRSMVSLDCFRGPSLFSEPDLFLSTFTANGRGFSDHGSGGSNEGLEGAIFDRFRPRVASAVWGRCGEAGAFSGFDGVLLMS